jgi:hypothetical protein
LASKDKKMPKRASRGPHEDNKFCILDGAKHDPKNFSIYITSFQSMAFCIFFLELNTPKVKLLTSTNSLGSGGD